MREVGSIPRISPPVPPAFVSVHESLTWNKCIFFFSLKSKKLQKCKQWLTRRVWDGFRLKPLHLMQFLMKHLLTCFCRLKCQRFESYRILPLPWPLLASAYPNRNRSFFILTLRPCVQPRCLLECAYAFISRTKKTVN